VAKHLIYFREPEGDHLFELDLPGELWDEADADEPIAAMPAIPSHAAPCRATPAAWRGRVGRLWSDGVRWSAACVLATGLAFFAGTYVNLGQRSAHAELMDEVTDYHRFFANDKAHFAELPPAQREELTAWMKQVGLNVPIPDLSATGHAYAGGRMYVSDDKPIVELFYAREGEPLVGLCITKRNGESEAVQVEEHDGLHLASWGEGDYTFIVVGAMDPGETRAISRWVAALTRQ
jgi:anti-sigma factor RsiW